MNLYEVCFSDGYSMCIKGIRKPTIEEATKFCEKDLKKYGDNVTVEEVMDCDMEYANGSFDMENYKNWPVFGVA